MGGEEPGQMELRPIDLHHVRVRAVDGGRPRVHGLEAIDGTPILDLKPVLGAVEER